MTRDKWVQRTADEYAAGFNNLLPTGPAWPRQPGTALQGVVLGLSGIWGNPVEVLAALLLKTESDPRTANVLLPDWERAFGLPDLCIPIPSTDIATREKNLVAKMIFLGSQDRAFFIAQAAAIAGQTITIREYAPYMTGVSRTGDTNNLNTDNDGKMRWQLGPPENRFYWTVKVTGLLSNWAGADSQCLLQRWKPAHTKVIFDYSLLQDLRLTRPWNSGYVAVL